MAAQMAAPSARVARPPTHPFVRATSSSSDDSDGSNVSNPNTSAATSDAGQQRLPRAAWRGRLPTGERVDDDPRRIDAVVMILEDVLFDHTSMLAHFAVDRAVHQLLHERAFPTIAAAFEALQTFRNAYGYRKRFPRFVDSLVAQDRLSPRAAARVVSAYYASEIDEAQSIAPFDRARDTLAALRDAGYALALVLVGKRDVQLERLHTLGLQSFFSELVFVDCNPSVAQLAKAMREVTRRLMLPPSSILFVGRKVFYELKAANQVGMVTARMLHGKYTSVMPIEELEQPDFQIATIDEVIAVVRLADQQLIKPKIVALGGGTGLAVLLKELRQYPADLTAIVTVFDSGRHSGELRKNLGILPPGDIRNCLVALSDASDLMHKLMNYRFKDDFMDGCSLGNLLLAALTDIQDNRFDRAIASLADILNIHGNVLPATLESTELCAELTDNSVVVSEVNVRSPTVVVNGVETRKAPIQRVFLQNPDVDAFLPAVRAIESADIIVLAPGGFYTSIIATLLVPGIRDAICRSAGATVYISNVATQCGQTDNLTLEDTIAILQSYLGSTHALDYVIANNVVPQSEALTPYFARGETLLLPTPAMADSVKPVLLQGRTFEELDRTAAGEWNKTPMIKHSGKMVVDMLYKIIDQELARKTATLQRSSVVHPRIPLTPRVSRAATSAVRRSQTAASARADSKSGRNLTTSTTTTTAPLRPMDDDSSTDTRANAIDVATDLSLVDPERNIVNATRRRRRVRIAFAALVTCVVVTTALKTRRR